MILQSAWATDAVYRLLDDETVKARRGRFSRADCERLWGDARYADMHPELLALMPEKRPPDLSQFLLSPMPGLLAEVAVKAGQEVRAGETLVVSVLSNGGLAAAVEGAGGTVVRTPVGDRYILDAMLVAGAGLGGEKSGHVIVAEHASTGDGILTALEVLRVLAESGRSLSELAGAVPLYPQEQRTVQVRHRDQWQADRKLATAVRGAEAELAGRGRVLVRPSGTEQALRIMVEGEDAARVTELADALAALAAERLH